MQIETIVGTDAVEMDTDEVFDSLETDTNEMPYGNPIETKPSAEAAIRYTFADSSLGLVLVAQSDAGLCAVLLGDDREQLRADLQSRYSDVHLAEAREALGDLAESIVRHVESPGTVLDTPLDVRGTDFQRTVWNALREIPAGSTSSYSEVAARIGNPKAVRAVARACAANTLAVLIPCHRVVTTEGKVSGYRWGVERKRALLRREAEASR